MSHWDFSHCRIQRWRRPWDKKWWPPALQLPENRTWRMRQVPSGGPATEKNNHCEIMIINYYCSNLWTTIISFSSTWGWVNYITKMSLNLFPWITFIGPSSDKYKCAIIMHLTSIPLGMADSSKSSSSTWKHTISTDTAWERPSIWF